MDINKMKALQYDELRALYRNFLHSQSIAKATVNTAYVDTFYLWRKVSKDLFWNAVTSTDFENAAKNALIKALSENSTGNVKSLVNSYLSHLRRFRLFLSSDGTAEPSTPKQEETANRTYTRKKKMDVDIPYPSIEQVEFYLVRWDGLENYHLQEDALNKLFFKLCPKNTDVIDILLKASTLNDFIVRTFSQSILWLSTYVLWTLIRDLKPVMLPWLEISSMYLSVLQRRTSTPLPQSIVATTIHSIIRFTIAMSMKYFDILEIVIAFQISKMAI